MEVVINPVRTLRGDVQVPGDKSISHRAVMLGALAMGETEIENFLTGEDCLSTIRVAQSLGVDIKMDQNRVLVRGGGLDALREPGDVLDAGNSGTTMRMMAGILAGCPFFSVLTGDASLRCRPMRRVIQPLTAMGARIAARGGNAYAPMAISGGDLCAITYTSPVASAQVKSAVLLAGLFADGPTTVIEPARSRDHTERMLEYFGARVEVEDKRVTVWGRPDLRGRKVTVPGDMSSAVFLLVAGATVPGAELVVRNVGINPTRAGALDILVQMGADLQIFNERRVNGEPVGDIRVRGGRLTGAKIGGAIIPYLIDELPALAVAAALAEGETVVRDAAELRYKETDRIDAVVKLLGAMGANITGREDGFIVRGGRKLTGTVCDSFGDHRIAMAAAVAGLQARGTTRIKEADCVRISYPAFFDTLNLISVQ
ncbi:3-phosphoshikimate 1-carboxyvinyltransferase [Desulfallas thermosapovorans]|uniref:3-phosphoshikimate 1-carboxyvinyltransferase n=1 Tax=Desulfallas thermosapovorans DSM 6562 TaxID=1121431 RepID=A0A5S4ZRM6_9FIRM|nr:3-phosphoshikimate 1-carboxyvinyltransferase [Desulfallas thermosapovorans]TYO95567.1 3-phosphoshikimate 1-carboxyvinyltransferase [Desulfallas thermosapovorans DSM 6562]